MATDSASTRFVLRIEILNRYSVYPLSARRDWTIGAHVEMIAPYGYGLARKRRIHTR